MKQDYLSDSNNDLIIQNGDFVQGDATDFQAKIIIYADKGEIRQYPLIGTSINKFLGSNIDENIIDNIISTELAYDNITLTSSEINISSKEVIINIDVI